MRRNFFIVCLLSNPYCLFKLSWCALLKIFPVLNFFFYYPFKCSATLSYMHLSNFDLICYRSLNGSFYNSCRLTCNLKLRFMIPSFCLRYNLAYKESLKYAVVEYVLYAWCLLLLNYWYVPCSIDRTKIN